MWSVVGAVEMTDQQDDVAAFPSEAATSIFSMTDGNRPVLFETC